MNVILVVETVGETETVVAASGSAVGVLVALGVVWSVSMLVLRWDVLGWAYRCL